MPSTFDESSPVVVVELSNAEAGELLGVSKVKGGNRMETIHLWKMCFIFYPAEGRCTAWVTVRGVLNWKYQSTVST